MRDARHVAATLECRDHYYLGAERAIKSSLLPRACILSGTAAPAPTRRDASLAECPARKSHREADAARRFVRNAKRFLHSIP